MKNKNKISKYRTKGFYILLLFSIITVGATALIVRNNQEVQKNENQYADLNQSIEGEKELKETSVSGNDSITEVDETDEELTGESIDESQQTGETGDIIVIDKEDIEKNKQEREEEKEQEEQERTAVQEETVESEAVQAAAIDEKETQEKEKAFVKFDENQLMVWPISGEIIMAFSPDTPIYDETLEHYRVNDSIRISGKIGAQVKAAASGIVESIQDTPETGVTLVIDHGNEWETTYGQLQKRLLIKEGDIVQKGQVIGGIEKPTKYTVLSGEHLYFAIAKDNEPVDPKKLLP